MQTMLRQRVRLTTWQPWVQLLIILVLTSESSLVRGFSPHNTGAMLSLAKSNQFWPNTSSGRAVHSSGPTATTTDGPDASEISNLLPSQQQTQQQHLSIEFCTGCRWMMRSAWMAQELLTTFRNDLDSISLIPNRSKPGGVFIVKREDTVLWDRKIQGTFPESKVLKQRVRDCIVPDRDLGHSDRTRNFVSAASITETSSTPPLDCPDCPDPNEQQFSLTDSRTNATLWEAPKPNVVITFNHPLLLRASWIAQELFTEFPNELNSVTLVPNHSILLDNGHAFKVTWNDEVVLWDRSLPSLKQQNSNPFPDPMELSASIREQLIGKPSPAASEDHMDDEEAEKLRKFFGVM